MACEDFCGLTKDEQRDFVRRRNEMGFRWNRDYDRIYMGLHRYATSLVYSMNNIDDIRRDEILADMPLRIVECMRTTRLNNLMTTMLNRIVHNLTVSLLRSKRKCNLIVRVDDLLPDNENAWDVLTSRNLDLVDEFPMDRSYTAQRVREAVEKLSPDHQQIINLSFYEEVDDESIAKMLKIPADTVRTRKHYAKKYLKRYLNERDIF